MGLSHLRRDEGGCSRGVPGAKPQTLTPAAFIVRPFVGHLGFGKGEKAEKGRLIQEASDKT